MFSPKTQHEINAADDIALVHAAKEGSMAAFEQLIQRHTVIVFRVAMHILPSREDAEEVVQDTFMRAFQSLNRFEERARFSTWLTRIAVNSSLMKLRVLRRSMALSLDEESEDGAALVDTIADWRPNPEQLYRSSELKKILLGALASLPEGYRVVFLLRDVEGFSTEETAEMLDLSINNVKSRLLRARLRLRSRLSRHFEGHDAEPLAAQQIQSALQA
jgi:RNA polymerase sigma-70 factor (ECF subfamily)